MKNKAIILLLAFSVLVLIAAIASVNNGWTGQSTGTISPDYGWQPMSDDWFTGTFNAGGVYVNGTWFADAGHPITVGNNGNFSLTIPFRVYNDSEIVFVGISTVSDPMDMWGWMLVGCPLGSAYNGEMGVTTGPEMTKEQINVTNCFHSFGFRPAYGALYTANVQSTDGGKTAVFSIGGHSMALPLSGVPQNVIVYIDDGGNDPAIDRVPAIYNVSFATSGFTPIQPPTSNSYTIPLNQGWNLVSFPVVNSSVSASSLASLGVSDVAQYDTTTGAFDIYMEGISPASYDFNLMPDIGYFIKSNKDVSMTVSGSAPVDRSASLSTGWNLVGWSTNDNSNAKSIVGLLTGKQDIARYNTTTGAFDIYMEGISPDAYSFAMHPGEGYFISTDTAQSLNYGGI